MPDSQTIDHGVPGLEQPADIVVDNWGIPHIRANTRHDVFFVQGFAAARDRLWQLDLWRKRGLGRLAADFGPGFLAQDRAARLFLYRGDMAAEWGAYGTPEAQSITEAFVQGINAWIALTQEQPDLLAPEFAAMGTRPERWDAADVVRIRSHGLVRNVLSEATRAQVIARADMETDLARRSIEPPWTPILPEGLDMRDIPAAALDVFKLATVRLDFSPDRLAATLDDAWRWTKVSDLGDVTAEGSNNWAVAGSRTATGRPILASDPHRAHALPSLRRIVHLTGPGIDAIGAGEPALPGVSIGHNGHAAFGLTIFPMDQEDLYVYETHPDDPDLYRYGDGWERMRTVRELVAVKGAPAQEVVLKFTRHGPVIHEDATARRAFAVRSVWFEPGSSAYFTSLAYLNATSPDAFAAALQHWSAPSVNQVYADRDGNIAWFTAGRTPIRPNWDGLLPVPGDGRYEWAGFHPLEDLPRSVNPARGFVATANEMNLPPDYPYQDRKLGFEWAEHSRTERIHAVLDAQPAHTVEQSMALQTDDLSIPARRLGALLAALPSDGDLAFGRDLLLGWDHHLARDSAAAALQEVWWSKHLRPALLDMLAPDPVVRALLVPGDTETLLALLEQPDHRLPDRDALLARTLVAAVADCRERLGPDASGWAWGRLHHGYFPHPLAPVAPLSPVAPGMRDVGPLPKGGSGSTPMAASYRLSDFRVTTGASFRMVVDVGNWDNSRAINAPGQSGDPRSPHYDDLAPLWAAGDYVPLLYSRDAVDAAARLRIRLSPR
ncbi:penicillin acylase family protein [Limobrevibacterium gyesilva]|uniref:Penicillin acylase family protein n=1 Tax=Limobrevibacterium gyesilva TaxID=2991712 RepID=A0AA41YIC1_9PROT|nr:penicillin acylase family protein [Limobrevibacterium gyesilva]MCW3474066.1 penicillin acylase family protein [Limobrevibacterium gyesilva]